MDASGALGYARYGIEAAVVVFVLLALKATGRVPKFMRAVKSDPKSIDSTWFLLVALIPIITGLARKRKGGTQPSALDSFMQ